MCTSVKKMHSSSNMPAEFEPPQENSSGSKEIYPTPSQNSNYYEEKPLFNEINEHHHEDRHKIIKKTWGISPVEIHEESAVNIDLPPIKWHGYETFPKILNVTNTGQTILINGQWARCRPYIEGGPLNGSYIFSQIHFHSPSEHEIDGRRYPLEMHAVHYKTSYLTQERAMEEKDGTVVLVYLFQVVNTNQTFLSSITNLANTIEKENDRTELQDVVLNQILQPFTSNYYLYWGSVSTTKNSYLLQWIISCSNLYVTQNEVDCLVKIMCTGGLLSEKQTPKMSPLNDAVYHVGEDDYNIPIPVETHDCNNLLRDQPQCQCRHICQSCNICTVHKGECQLYVCPHTNESHNCLSTSCSRRDINVQTSSCERTLKVISKSSVCSGSLKKKENGKNTGCCQASTTCICSSVSSNSQSSVCEDGKKKKKKKKGFCKALKVSSCPSVSKTLEIISCNDEGNIKEKSFSWLSLKKFGCSEEEKNVCEIKKKESKIIKEICSQQSKSNSLAKKSSKLSIKSSKQKKKKPVAPKPEKNKKKEKPLKKLLDYNENVAGSSKPSVNDIKKIKKKKLNENCDPLVNVQCMPALECVEKKFELLSDINFNIQEKNEEKLEVSEPKELIEFCNSERSIQIKEDIVEEKSLTMSEPNNEIKTIFEKKRAYKNQEPIVKDCTVNFLLSPNIVQSDPSYTLVMSESEIVEKAKHVEKEYLSQIIGTKTKMNSSSILKFEKKIDSKEQPKELCLQTEIFFHTEKQGDFSACLSQDYNVAIIYNRNVLQEFKGTFSPKQLELGSYEKLELVPKYPDTENISVRLEDCFVKKESVDGFYIRARFLLSKIHINNNVTDADIEFSANAEAQGITSVNIRKDAKDQSSISKNEKPLEDDKSGKAGNSDESVLKNKILDNQKFEVEVKKLDTDPEMNDKSFTRDSLQETSEPIRKEEKRKKDFVEKSEKKLRDLFSKRKKTVYFVCEKIEKDDISGKKIFVGSFRTKDEIKALAKHRKARVNPDSLFPIEKSLESKKKEKLFLLSNKDSDFQKLIRVESLTKQESKLQSTFLSKETDKLDNTKDLITLHTYKPRNSRASCFKNESKNIEFQDEGSIKKSNTFSPEEIIKENNSEKSVDSSSLGSEKFSGINKSQIALIIIPIEGEDLSKIEVILIEHLEKNVNDNDSNEKDNNEEPNYKNEEKNNEMSNYDSKDENDEASHYNSMKENDEASHYNSMKENEAPNCNRTEENESPSCNRAKQNETPHYKNMKENEAPNCNRTKENEMPNYNSMQENDEEKNKRNNTNNNNNNHKGREYIPCLNCYT